MTAQVITHLTYTELFKTFEKKGILIPTSSIKNSSDVEDQIAYLLQDINPIELIQFSSFLNMICQSTGKDMSMVRGVSLLEETNIIKPGTGFKNKIIFHRENLLNLIGQILEKNLEGKAQMTGTGDIGYARKYTEAILLNNDLLNLETNDTFITSKEMILKDYFIREWPHYYISDISKNIYGHRIVRYHYCYDTLLPQLPDSHKKIMEGAIQSFESSVGVTLKEYLHVASGLFGWFLEWPLNREKPDEQNKPKQKFGFDFKNIDSFYISKQAFAKDPAFLRIIDALSKDIPALREAAEEERNRERDIITGYNKHIRIFFDNPIFKISENHYCIIDLKFILENACGGLMWRLRGQENLQDYKSSYGYLLEEYFKFLVEQIFKGAKITFGGAAGADAIVELEDIVLVIEFTTEYYRLSSLYNNSSEGFLEDAYRILFNAGADDPRGRNKSDRGKLLKLNDYVETAKQSGKKIIPILVTENLLGNPDLFNDFSNFYNSEIDDKSLSNLKAASPLFLCLDDLETFWGLYESKDAVKGMADFSEDWAATDKGPQFHNASSGICRFVEKQKGEAIIINKEFADFFAPKNIYKH